MLASLVVCHNCQCAPQDDMYGSAHPRRPTAEPIFPPELRKRQPAELHLPGAYATWHRSHPVSIWASLIAVLERLTPNLACQVSASELCCHWSIASGMSVNTPDAVNCRKPVQSTPFGTQDFSEWTALANLGTHTQNRTHLSDTRAPPPEQACQPGTPAGADGRGP